MAILSKDRERNRGEVDCWALRSDGRESGGRLEEDAGFGVVCCAKSSTSVVGGTRLSSRDLDRDRDDRAA